MWLQIPSVLYQNDFLVIRGSELLPSLQLHSDSEPPERESWGQQGTEREAAAQQRTDETTG